MLHATLLVLLLSSAFAAHPRLRRRVQPDTSSPTSNYLQDVPDTPTAFSTFHMQRGDNHTPQESSNFVTKHEYQPSRALAPHHDASSAAFNARHHEHLSVAHGPLKLQPTVNVRRQLSEKEAQFHKKKINPEYNYILTAGGKENVYAEDMVGGYKPQRQFDGSTAALPNKKHEKSFKKHRYAYTSHRGESGLHQPEKAEIRPDAGRPDQTRAFGFPDSQNYPQYVNPAARFEAEPLHGAKSSAWTQLGPNVEISSSAEHPAFAPKLDRAQEQKLNKKRKNPAKNVRTGYMSPQHALYVANTLQSVRPPKGGLFDHNNVLKQSDKFEITDAMFQELEQEARKAGDPQIRIKQESPKDLYKYQPEYTNYHYYQPQVTPLLNVAPLDGTAYSGKYYQPYPLGALSKGFVRNIEIETGAGGAKKSIPALIIPLTPEQLNMPMFNSEVGLYVNSPETLNPGTKHKNMHPSFPYDIVNSRFTQNDVLNGVVPVENYQYQQAAPYGFRTVEEPYNPYVHYQAHNVFRLPYLNNNGAVSPTPTSVDAKTPAAYSTQSVAHQNTLDTRSAPPYSVSIPKKAHKLRHPRPQGQHTSHPSQPHEQQLGQLSPLAQTSSAQPLLNHQGQSHQLSQSQPHQSEHAKSDNNADYAYEQDIDDKYLSPAESSHVTTVSSFKEKDQKSSDKSEARRN